MENCQQDTDSGVFNSVETVMNIAYQLALSHDELPMRQRASR